MGLEIFYPEGEKPIYPEDTDRYLSDIPLEDSLDIPADLARNPSKAAVYVRKTLAANRYTLRELEVKRRALAFRASVLSSLDPELLATLPPEVQQEILEWSSRMQK